MNSHVNYSDPTMSHSRRRAALRELLRELQLDALLVTDLLNIR
jgi:hypothetical protein